MKNTSSDADNGHVTVGPTGAVEQHAVDIGCRPGEDEGDRPGVAQVGESASAGGAAQHLAVPDHGNVHHLGHTAAAHGDHERCVAVLDKAVW